MQANYVQRLRFTFSKTGPARFTGHLDLARTLERSFNRAQLPVAYTQGFNQRPRLAFAAPLPLGFASDYELADIRLREELDPLAAGAQMMRKMAPGITITSIEEVPLRSPSLQSLTRFAHYTATFLDALNAEDLASRVEHLMSETSVMRERRKGKGKVQRYDLRPLIDSLAVREDQDGALALDMILYLMPGKSGRPDEVLAAMGLDPLLARIKRTLIVLADAAEPA